MLLFLQITFLGYILIKFNIVTNWIVGIQWICFDWNHYSCICWSLRWLVLFSVRITFFGYIWIRVKIAWSKSRCFFGCVHPSNPSHKEMLSLMNKLVGYSLSSLYLSLRCQSFFDRWSKEAQCLNELYEPYIFKEVCQCLVVISNLDPLVLLNITKLSIQLNTGKGSGLKLDSSISLQVRRNSG
jgi:hypothetical protein